MKLNDIIALARAGYRLDDIKKMEEDEAKQKEEQNPEDKPKQEEEKKPEDNPDEEEEEKQPTEDKKKITPEEKAVEDLKKQLADAQEALKKAQADNLSQDISGKKESDEDILAKAIRGFM